MALTLAEAAKLSNDTLIAGVIETIVKDNPLLERLPFVDVPGTSLTYNQESTLAGANFYDVGDTWVESTAEVTQKTAVLRILGGDADVDSFLQQTRSNINDLEGTQIELKAKAVRHAFEENFFYGDNGTDSKEFDGLHDVNLIPAAQQVHMGDSDSGNPLNLMKLDEAIDMVRGEKADLMVMTRAIRRRITQHTRASGYHFEVSKDEIGRQLLLYGDVPLFISDHLVQTELQSGSSPYGYSAKTGGYTSTIFIMRFGEDGVCGLTSGGIQILRLGTLETKDATRTRIKWYCSLANFSTLSASLVDGITDAAVTDA
jgi:hypothetical protein